MKWLVCCLPLAVLAMQAQAQAIRVNPDRAAVMPGQSFQVTFSTNKADARTPDWTPLAKDFYIVATHKKASEGVDTQDRQDSLKMWVAELRPRRSGSLLVPPLSFGPYTSAAKPIQVHTQLAKAPRDFFIEIKADPPSPYVQAETVLTYRFFLSLIHI